MERKTRTKAVILIKMPAPFAPVPVTLIVPPPPEILSVLLFHSCQKSNPVIAAGACGVVGNAKRCPSACGQPVGLSIRCGKSISPEKTVSYDTGRDDKTK
jgi:hypothetical protein